jgi:hypothetical protein
MRRIEIPLGVQKSETEGILEEHDPGSDLGWLLLALNYPAVDSIFWWGQESFSASLMLLVEELKEQLRILREGRPRTKAAMDAFLLRYERHKRTFQEVQLERHLLPSYSSVLTLSSQVGNEGLEEGLKKQRQHQALNALLDLVQKSELDYLRRCTVCRRWYIAVKIDQSSCSKACRQRKSWDTPEQLKRRQDNYQHKKAHPAKKRKRKHHA